MGMCRWIGSHFYNWIDNNGVAFLVELLEWGRTVCDFWDKKILVSRDLRWLETVFAIFFTRKQFTFIYIIITFMVAT